MGQRCKNDLVDERFQLIQLTIAVALTSAHTMELIHYMLLLPVPKELQGIHLFKDCQEVKNDSETDQSLLPSHLTLFPLLSWLVK